MICRRHRAISLLMGYSPALLDFFFNAKRTRLRCGRCTLRREAALLDQQCRLLIEIALDIWGGTNGARLLDACRFLAPHHFDCFLAAMEYLAATASLECRCNRCRDIRTNDVRAARSTSSRSSSPRPATTKGDAHAEATDGLRPI